MGSADVKCSTLCSQSSRYTDIMVNIIWCSYANGHTRGVLMSLFGCVQAQHQEYLHSDYTPLCANVQKIHFSKAYLCLLAYAYIYVHKADWSSARVSAPHRSRLFVERTDADGGQTNATDGVARTRLARGASGRSLR